MSPELAVAIAMTVIAAATPILIAALGELVVEKSGVLNLGVEGMMLLGALAAFAAGVATGSPALSLFAGAAAGCAGSGLFALLALGLAANQVATGLALTIFGVGLSALLGEELVGVASLALAPVFPPALADHPHWRLAFGHDVTVYLSLALCAAVSVFLFRTRAGLVLRAVGEDDHSAHALGFSVLRIRLAAILFGGAMAGLAGSCFSLALTPMWVEELTAGRGWIALALVVFSGWRPGRLLLGAYLFGAVLTMELHAKAAGVDWFAPEFLAASPYLATIFVLAFLTARDKAGRHAPGALGRPFRRSS